MKKQKGATLVIGLVMLLMITLMSIAAFKLGKGNIQIVGNMQQRALTLAAAQTAIEQVASSSQFANSPTDAILSPCLAGTTKQLNTVCIDYNGDGKSIVKAVVTPTLRKVQIIPNTALSFTSADDAGCLVEANQTFGIAGSASINSLCSDETWDVQAVASDSLSGASSTLNQGISIRQPAAK